jgi:hypothetical protein
MSSSRIADGIEGDGYLIQFGGMTNGSQVGNSDFAFARSVSITFALTLSEQSYFVTRTQAMSIPQTISSVVGSLTGVLSFLGTVLGFVEKCRSAPSGGGGGGDSEADQTTRHDSSGGDDLADMATPVKNPILLDTASMRPQRQATGANPASLGARSDSLFVGIDGPGVELTTPAAVSPRTRRTESALPRRSSAVPVGAATLPTHETVANMLAASTRRAAERAPDAHPALFASPVFRVPSPPRVHSPPRIHSPPRVQAPVAPVGAGRAASQSPDLQPRHRAILERFRDVTGGDADF